MLQRTTVYVGISRSITYALSCRIYLYKGRIAYLKEPERVDSRVYPE